MEVQAEGEQADEGEGGAGCEGEHVGLRGEVGLPAREEGWEGDCGGGEEEGAEEKGADGSWAQGEGEGREEERERAGEAPEGGVREDGNDG